MVAVVTHDYDRTELVREFDWGTETFLETVDKRFGIPISTSFDLVSRTYAPPGPETELQTRELTTSYRVGAICADGWRSGATGRGACSYHGGVNRWLVEERTETQTIEVAVQHLPPSKDYVECQNGRSASNPCSDAEWASTRNFWDNLDITDGSLTPARRAAADLAVLKQTDD